MQKCIAHPAFYAPLSAFAMPRWQGMDKNQSLQAHNPVVREQDPSIKDMADQIAQDPAFAQMTSALQQSIGAGGECFLPISAARAGQFCRCAA